MNDIFSKIFTSDIHNSANVRKRWLLWWLFVRRWVFGGCFNGCFDACFVKRWVFDVLKRRRENNFSSQQVKKWNISLLMYKHLRKTGTHTYLFLYIDPCVLIWFSQKIQHFEILSPKKSLVKILYALM